MLNEELEGPLVTLAVPVHNGARYLRLTLASLFAQDYPYCEFLLCDNGSTDETPEIFAAAAHDPRVRCIRRETAVDAVRNWNQLIEEASGKYFCWAADDDLWEPGFVSTLVGLLEAEPEAVLGFSGAALIDGEGAPLPLDPRSSVYCPRRGSLARKAQMLWASEAGGKALYVAGIVRTDVMRAVGGFQRYGLRAWGLDVLLLHRVLGHGFFVKSPATLFKKRVHGASQSERNPAKLHFGCLPDEQIAYFLAYRKLLESSTSGIERFILLRLWAIKRVLWFANQAWLRRGNVKYELGRAIRRSLDQVYESPADGLSEGVPATEARARRLACDSSLPGAPADRSGMEAGRTSRRYRPGPTGTAAELADRETGLMHCGHPSNSSD